MIFEPLVQTEDYDKGERIQGELEVRVRPKKGGVIQMFYTRVSDFEKDWKIIDERPENLSDADLIEKLFAIQRWIAFRVENSGSPYMAMPWTEDAAPMWAYLDEAIRRLRDNSNEEICFLRGMEND